MSTQSPARVSNSDRETTARLDDDGVKWLALLIRQGLKLIVAGIERRYGLDGDKAEDRYGTMRSVK